jgi:putative oxidoreductase
MIDQKTAPYAALILRITMGIMFLAHGFMKLLVFTPAGTAQFFESIGLPGWFGEIVMVGEIVGGVALVVGFYARYVALLFIPDLLGAIFFVHGANGWGFGNKGGGWEYPAFWAVVLLVQYLLGDGPYTLRKSECRCVTKSAEPSA